VRCDLCGELASRRLLDGDLVLVYACARCQPILSELVLTMRIRLTS
jgi:hypothetical protein